MREEPPQPLERAWIDPRFLAATLSWPAVLACSLSAFALARAMNLPAVRDQLGLVGTTATWVWATYPATYVLAALLYRRTRHLRRAFPYLLAHAIAIAASVGACARSDSSPGWALLLLVPPCWAQLFPAHPIVALYLVLTPPLLRWVAVPGASLGIAAGIGVATAALYLLLSVRGRATFARERRDLAREAFDADTIDDAAALVIAMRLHDKLSGPVTLGHAMARSGGDTRLASQRVLGIARALRAELERHAPDPRTAIEQYAHSLGVPLTLTIDAVVDPRDLIDIATEMIGNQAKHGGRAPIDIGFQRRGAALVAAVTHAPFENEARGRGLRWLEARVTARGGSLLRDGAHTTIVLPDRNEASRWLGHLELAFYLAAPLAAFALGGNRAEVSVVAALSAVLLGVHLNNARTAGGSMEATRANLRLAIDQATEAPRAFARAVVDRAIARLEAAGSRDAERDALIAVAAELDAALERLEQSPVLGSTQDAATDGEHHRLGPALHP